VFATADTSGTVELSTAGLGVATIVILLVLLIYSMVQMLLLVPGPVTAAGTLSTASMSDTMDTASATYTANTMYL